MCARLWVKISGNEPCLLCETRKHVYMKGCVRCKARLVSRMPLIHRKKYRMTAEQMQLVEDELARDTLSRAAK